MSLYPVFADWAKRYGLDAAVERFRGSLPDKITEFREQFERDLAKVQAGGPPVIAAGRETWYSWPGEEGLFWPALKASFISDNWPEERVRAVDSASTQVVAHTPRPSRPAWDAKGLVVGYVQSGKTTNFTAVIAKLADVDYQFVIVLSGIHNGLRRQTQVRLDEQLKDESPGKWHTLTDEERDFPMPSYRPSAVLNSDKIVLAVIKKNASVLGRLIKWLNTADGRDALQTTRVLVIDDEADQASVATGRINPLIRKLLKLMPRCTYVGYTATPFANVFIDPTQDDDLYPKTFILNLPRPEGYFGPEMIFGRDEVEGEDLGSAPDGYDMVRNIPENQVSLLRPVGKQAAGAFTPVITSELRDAVFWFWLATAARRARGDEGHSTMLIHTSVKIDVQEAFRPLLVALRDEAVMSLREGQLDSWRQRWIDESARVPAQDWERAQNTADEVLAHLPQVLEATTVILDNYRSQERLNYTKDKPVVAIAVGGNTLSRGLTLEGLVVSFFVRAATAYDTLLQMGRWFGYRTGYEDLPRIWMTPSLCSAFRHLATVEHEMRDDIDRYQRQDLTPMDVAVRIRTHPLLRITAKMGAAQSAYVSYAGRRLQTRYFFTDNGDWLAGNLLAGEVLVQEARRRGEASRSNGSWLIRDVPVGLVKSFLAEYKIHEDSPDLDPKLLLRYIDRQLEAAQPSLQTWSVAVVGGTGGEVSIGGLELKAPVRARLNDHDSSRADIKTLMSKQDRAIDLTLPAGASPSEAKLVEMRNEDPVYKDRGLIVLYPIDAQSKPVNSEAPSPAGEPFRLPLKAKSTVLGLGIVFPGNAEQKNRVQATHVSVDLTDVESENLDDVLDQDTEDVTS